jgi:uncharacterized protein (TIGR02117 family)
VNRQDAMRVVRACRWLAVLTIPVAAACAAPSGTHPVPTTETTTRILYVVSHGWHTGIVLHRRDIDTARWPEAADFPQADYLEVGWGDRDYYRATDPGLWLAIKAALWPAPGVLHVVGFRGSVAAFFPMSEIVPVAVTEPGLERLSALISASYERDAHGHPVPLGPALYGQGRFYASRENFHLFRTCNVWTAQALSVAGVEVSPVQSLTASGLLTQLRKPEATLPARP